jgi:predicted transport protein
MEKGLLEKTGKSLEEWIAVVKKQNFAKHGEIMKFLKSEHGFTHGYANFVSLKARASDAASFEETDLLAMQYGKGKEQLKPIYEKLVQEIGQLGDDIEFVPKKANVSVRRKKQFALIQPSTKTRVDLGLKLPGKEQGGRLGGSGRFGSMCTHSVQITSLEEVDDQIVSWLREAYEMAG